MKAPNGNTSYLETFFEIVSFVTLKREAIELLPDCEIKKTQNERGTGGFYELAEDWADEFEERHKAEDWAELDFFETIEAFCEEKNNEQINFNNHD